MGYETYNIGKYIANILSDRKGLIERATSLVTNLEFRRGFYDKPYQRVKDKQKC